MLAVADEDVVAVSSPEGVVAKFAAECVGEKIAPEIVGFLVANDDAITGGEEAWSDD